MGLQLLLERGKFRLRKLRAQLVLVLLDETLLPVDVVKGAGAHGQPIEVEVDDREWAENGEDVVDGVHLQVPHSEGDIQRPDADDVAPDQERDRRQQMQGSDGEPARMPASNLAAKLKD